MGCKLIIKNIEVIYEKIQINGGKWILIYWYDKINVKQVKWMLRFDTKETTRLKKY